MRVTILDFDGSVAGQRELMPAGLVHLQEWAPTIRLACSFGRFRRFESELTRWLGDQEQADPASTFYGSGDFHHVSLTLIRRLRTTVNVLVIDNHPDWMRGIPFLHCGTWLYHTARLPHVHRVFHVGGDVDFDNYYQPLAPWSMIRSGQIVVFPAVRQFSRGGWTKIPNQPVRAHPEKEVSRERLLELLRPFRDELARRPLYISVDKDVIKANEAIVNWDSGHLSLADVKVILTAFLDCAMGKLAGMDIVGDWSPVNIRGLLPACMHLTMHPRLEVNSDIAQRRNQETNVSLLACIDAALKRNATSRMASSQ